MQKKRWMAAALAGAMALTLTACGGTDDTAASTDDSTSTAESSGDVKKISVIMKTSSAEYWQYIKASRSPFMVVVALISMITSQCFFQASDIWITEWWVKDKRIY